MTRLRIELGVYCAALPLWMLVTHAPAVAWLLTLGVVMGWLTAIALTLPRPWDR